MPEKRLLTGSDVYMVVDGMVEISTLPLDSDKRQFSPLKPVTVSGARFLRGDLILKEELTPAEVHRLLRIKGIKQTSMSIVEKDIHDKLIQRLSEGFPSEVQALIKGDPLGDAKRASTKDLSFEDMMALMRERFPEKASEIFTSPSAEQV